MMTTMSAADQSPSANRRHNDGESDHHERSSWTTPESSAGSVDVSVTLSSGGSSPATTPAAAAVMEGTGRHIDERTLRTLAQIDWVCRTRQLRDLLYKNQHDIGISMDPEWKDPFTSHVLNNHLDPKRVPPLKQQQIIVDLYGWCVTQHNALLDHLGNFCLAHKMSHSQVCNAIPIDMATYNTWVLHDLTMSIDDRFLIDYHVVNLLEKNGYMHVRLSLIHI